MEAIVKIAQQLFLAEFSHTYNGANEYIYWHANRILEREGVEEVLKHYPVPRERKRTADLWPEYWDKEGRWLHPGESRNHPPKWWLRTEEEVTVGWLQAIRNQGSRLNRCLTTHIIVLAYKQRKLSYQYDPALIRGRPLDMGGPRDVWIEQSPWDEI